MHILSTRYKIFHARAASQSAVAQLWCERCTERCCAFPVPGSGCARMKTQYGRATMKDKQEAKRDDEETSLRNAITSLSQHTLPLPHPSSSFSSGAGVKKRTYANTCFDFRTPRQQNQQQAADLVFTAQARDRLYWICSSYALKDKTAINGSYNELNYRVDANILLDEKRNRHLLLTD